MKKTIAQAALNFCIIFTLTMAAFLVMGYVFAGPSYGLNLTASVYSAALGLAALQAFWFSGAAIKKLAYPLRILGFGMCGLPVLGGCAQIGQWLPSDVPGVHSSFVIVYLIILAITTTIFTVYFKKTAGSYDEALARYREENRR